MNSDSASLKGILFSVVVGIFYTQIFSMVVYLASVFSQESGPGSSATFLTIPFSTPEKRGEFTKGWVLENETLGRTKYGELEYGSGGWTYSLETNDVEMDCEYAHGSDLIIKRY